MKILIINNNNKAKYVYHLPKTRLYTLNLLLLSFERPFQWTTREELLMICESFFLSCKRAWKLLFNKLTSSSLIILKIFPWRSNAQLIRNATSIKFIRLGDLLNFLAITLQTFRLNLSIEISSRKRKLFIVDFSMLRRFFSTRLRARDASACGFMAVANIICIFQDAFLVPLLDVKRFAKSSHLCLSSQKCVFTSSEKKETEWFKRKSVQTVLLFLSAYLSVNYRNELERNIA